jgi:hypothetical protein
MTSIDGREAIEAMLRKEFIAKYRELCEGYGIYLFPGNEGNIEINRIWGGKWDEEMLEFIPGIDAFRMRVKYLEARDARTLNLTTQCCDRCGEESGTNNRCEACTYHTTYKRERKEPVICGVCGTNEIDDPDKYYACEECVPSWSGDRTR